MIKESYCSLETAKLLKEKGFDEPCQYFYKFDDNKIYRGTVFTNTQIGDKFYNAPTQQMVLKWLREEKNIYIVPKISYSSLQSITWYFDIYSFINGHLNIYMENNQWRVDTYDLYEEAVEAGIKYVLENLI